jgi:ribosomal protein L14E/L6E/L27E
LEVRTLGFHPGQLVIATAGRESGSRFVIMNVDDKFVFLADGRKRQVDRPKRKNPRHVRLLMGCNETNGLTNDAIRQALRAVGEEV